MLAAGIQSPVPLEELENHLREEIEQHIRSGASEQAAFEISAANMGRPGNLDREFKKDKRTSMKKIAIIVLGIIGILVGPAVFLPALAQHNQMGIWNSGIIIPMLIGALITVIGISTTAFGFKKQKA